MLLGPLIMLPQAVDNYGTDSCSILVTKTTPPMITIGTKTNGRVHHCVVLHNNQDQFNAGEIVSSKVCYWFINTFCLNFTFVEVVSIFKIIKLRIN